MAPEEASSPDEGAEKTESLDDVKHRDVRDLDQIPPEESDTVLGQALKEQVALKRDYGRWMLWMMAGQLALTNVIFVAIVWIGFDWKVHDSVLHVWLAGTFVQIVSVVAIIVRSLFSGDDIKAATEMAAKRSRG
jgi:hypothetical protein